jgi:hypothetical protein
MTRRRTSDRNAEAARRGTVASSAARGASSDPAEGGDVRLRVVRIVLAALFAARWMLPAESALAGDTLWLVQLAWGAALLWCWARWRSGEPVVRIGPCEIGLGLLVAGHLLSGAALAFGGGDLRAAANLCCEWGGLAAGLVLLHQELRDAVSARRWTAGLLCAAGVLAAYGLWQHFVWYPRTANEYRTRRDELDTLVALSEQEATAEQARRRQQLETEFSVQGIPLEGRPRQLWESRLLGSSEPFGLFALANSFAGLLAPASLLLAGCAAGAGRAAGSPSARRALLVPGVLLALVAACLLLTKSRTAFVGTATGLVWWGAVSWAARHRRARGMEGAARREGPTWLPAAIGGALLAGLVALVAWGGGLDREVWSESPRSLRFRLQYWLATASLLRERPLFGAGPGNFRQAYLAHKLPEASEEIADPHDLFLDVWANGGLVALGGLGVLLAWGLRRAWEAGRDEGESSAVSLSPPDPATTGAGSSFASALRTAVRDPWCVGTVAGPLLAWFGGFLLEGTNEWRLPVVAGAVLVALAAWLRGSESLAPSCGAIGGAFVALAVHLTGAGGIEMPAVFATLCLPLLLLEARRTESASGGASESNVAPSAERASWAIALGPRGFVVLGAASVAALLLGQRLAFAPTVARRAAMIDGFDAHVRGRTEAARAAYERAAAADAWSAEPWSALAESWFATWRATGGDDAAVFASGEKAERAAIARDPHSAGPWRRLGEAWTERFARTGIAEHARQAAEAYRESVARYPQEATLRADFALALQSAHEPEAARVEAERALALDAIARREGHADRFLPEPLAARVREIVEAKR